MTRYIDVFNGDADGICALHQLRQAEPAASELVTGLKREAGLLDRVRVQRGDIVTVLDISLDRNRTALGRLLEDGAVICYYDHHDARAIEPHGRLELNIDTDSAQCTSTIVDRVLGGRFRSWAVVGAFGDGLDGTAQRLAGEAGIGPHALEVLRELGIILNYNAYGETDADVIVQPAELYRIVSRQRDPLDLVHKEPLIAHLSHERHADLERALETPPTRSLPMFDAYVLPDAAWSRRVSGTFANRLVERDPRRAHAVLTPLARGGYVVSVRSPADSGYSAADFCSGFPTGGGRRVAAGIDHLHADRVEPFLAALSRVPWTLH